MWMYVVKEKKKRKIRPVFEDKVYTESMVYMIIIILVWNRLPALFGLFLNPGVVGIFPYVKEFGFILVQAVVFYFLAGFVVNKVTDRMRYKK